MKKSIKTIWAVGITLIMLVSMLVVAVPASASTLAWSAAGQPNPYLSNQIKTGSDVNLIRVAPNGDIFVVDRGASPNVVWKSVNGGQTWTTTATNGNPWSANASAQIVDLQISPSYATDSTVFVLVNSAPNVNVYLSTNAGSSFAQLGGNVATGVSGTAMAIEPTYSAGTGQIAVATAKNGSSGNVYTWGYTGILNWTTTAFNFLSGNIDAIAFSPLYPIDATFMAVTSNASGTYLNFKVASTNWGSSVNPVKLNSSTAANITGASLAFPSDFNASIASSRNVFVATNGGDSSPTISNNIFRVTSTGSTSLSVVSSNQSVASVAYKGTYASGTLYAGLDGSTTVYYTNNANSTTSVTWVPTAKAPTGASDSTGATVVALSGNNVYAGTTGDESAFSVSYDGGADFYQIGLIDTGITGLDDLAFADSQNWFLATDNTTSGALESLWKSTDGGSTWLRINTLAATSTHKVGIALSPNYATDSTMYFYEKGGDSSSKIYLSQDGGNTWSQRAFPSGIGTVSQVVAVDQYTIYVADGSNGTVYKSVNNGWTWTSQTLTGATGIAQLKLDPASGALLAGTVNSLVFLSTDGTTWTQQGAAVSSTSGNMTVAFDANYGTNGDIYAALNTAGGVYRQTAGAATTVSWFNIDTNSVSSTVADILVAPDGTLYASSSSSNASVMRALVPTSGAGTVKTSPAPVMLSNTTNSGFLFPANSTLSQLDYLPGSNIIYSIDTTNNKIDTYEDTLSTPIPAVTSPAADAIVQNSAVKVVVEPLTGDPGTFVYQVQWNTRNDWLGTGGTENITGYPYYSRTLGTSNGASTPPAGSAIYYRVRTIGPIVGPWSTTMTVQTQLATASSPNAPTMISTNSLDGATVQGGFNVDPTASFFWGAVTGATNYEFQLATDAGMTNLVVDATGANALGNVLAYTVSSPLDYGTMYYWRVRATSATSETSWSNVQAFRVMEQPTQATSTATGPAPAPTTITITQPTITFTQPAVTQTTFTVPPAPAATEVGPAYIWAIIIIGAVLVIAVIVLIVRTRRSV